VEYVEEIKKYEEEKKMPLMLIIEN